jgi:hypothetical protein
MLEEKGRWVCWRWEWRNGKWTKPPIQCGAGYPNYARTDDPATWGDYAEAAARVAAGGVDGIGYNMLGANLGAIDLDDCYILDTKITAQWAQEIISRAPQGIYGEITVSGSGLRVIGEANGPPLDTNFPMPHGGKIELYRNKARYITISGNEIPSLKLNGAGSLANIDEFLDMLRTEFKQEKAAKRAQGRMPRQGNWAYGAMHPGLFKIIENDVPEGERSDQFHYVINRMKELDWSVDRIVWLLELYPQGIASKYTGRLRQEVERAFNKKGAEGTHLCDFFAYGPQNKCMHVMTRKLWSKETINECLPKVAIVTRNGKLKVNAAGSPILIKPASWLMQNRLITDITWVPGLPMLIYDKVVINGVGWIDAPGKVVFNSYIPPEPSDGDPRKAGPWVWLAHKLYGRYARRVIWWFAHRAQLPQKKINHGIMFGGVFGIGKDTLLMGVRHTYGEWIAQCVHRSICLINSTIAPKRYFYC